jgi:hypothetical protein
MYGAPQTLADDRGCRIQQLRKVHTADDEHANATANINRSVVGDRAAICS